MDLQTGLIYAGVVVVSAVVILFVSMFGIKEKSYEEAIAEQRKLPDDLLLAKKDKGKEKKHKSKTGKKVKEKKEDMDEKDEKPDHVQFEEMSQVLSVDTNVQKENLNEITHAESTINKSPKETPTKSKKNITKEPIKKKEEIKEEKQTEINMKESNVNAQSILPMPLITKEISKESKELPKVVRKDNLACLLTPANRESKKNKKKIDVLAQLAGDKDRVNVSLLMPLVQKAELSRSEIQILIDQLLNKQLDNPMEHSEWTEGRADPVIKLKKQLAEKDKALAEEHEASATFQNKLKELRAELNSERSRYTMNVKQLEEALNGKITEAQTLHTRMQHILESHAAEKQGFARQIEQLQSKVNEDAAIIHKMQEDQGQTQGHLQQELIAQRKQLEVQFSQMRENENALKSQLAQKHVEVQELQNVNMNVTQELQATCESSSAEIEMLRQQLAMMQDQCIHSEGQLQHLKEAGDRLQDMAQQLDEAHRTQADLDHRLKSAHRHEQELQKQLHSQQTDIKMLEVEANNVSTLKAELNKLQNELMKYNFEADEVNKLRSALNIKDEEIKKVQTEYLQMQSDMNKSGTEMKKLEISLNEKSNELNKMYSEMAETHEELKQTKIELSQVQRELGMVKDELSKATIYAKMANEASSELKKVKAELEKLQNSHKISNAERIQITKLQKENALLLSQMNKSALSQKEVNYLRELNDPLLLEIGSITECQAAEGRENGIAKKSERNNVEHLLNSTIDKLQRDIDNQNALTKRLHEDLELQRLKNNENIEKIRVAEQESMKSLLQRIFPEIKIVEQPYDKWIEAFEQSIRNTSQNNSKDNSSELEKQNKILQGLVAHYKQIIVDTEGMLNNLQSNVESEESRWRSELRQQEAELVNLRLILKELKNKQTFTDNLQEKILELEQRLQKEEKLEGQTKAEHEAFKSSHKSSIKNDNFNLSQVEQLEEQKLQLLHELETERSKVSSLNAELNKLQQSRDQAYPGDSSSGAQTLNDPESSDASKKNEGGSGKK